MMAVGNPLIALEAIRRFSKMRSDRRQATRTQYCGESWPQLAALTAQAYIEGWRERRFWVVHLRCVA